MVNPSSFEATAATVPNLGNRALPHLPEEFAGLKGGFDFRRLWHSLIEKIWIVALCVLAGLFLALGYLARTPKLYQGHTVLEVEFQEPRVVPAEESASRMGSMFLASQEAMRTIEQNLTNETLLARVIRSEGLAEDGGRALLGQNITGRDAAKATPRPLASPTQNKMDNASGVTTFTPLEEALGRAIKGMVTPVIRRGTRLIDVYVTNRDPAMAQRLAEAIGRWLQHMLGVDATVEPVSEMRSVPLIWYIGLDAEGTRIGDALWHGEDLDEKTHRRVVGLFRLTFGNSEETAVYLILAMTADGVLRMKPQNLLVGLPPRCPASLI